MIKLNQRFAGAAVLAVASALGGCANLQGEPQIERVPECDDACRNGRYIAIMLGSPDPNLRAVAVRTLEKADPKVKAAADAARAQLGLENAAASGQTIRATVLNACPDNKPGTCAMVSPVPGTR